MDRRMRAVFFSAVVGLFSALMPLHAQLQKGDFTSTLDGYISTGYTASSGDQSAISSHNWDIGGSTTLNGYYYSPSFLNYIGAFYANQSKANSDFKSVSNTSGFNLDTVFFTGSHFPGSVGYAQTFDSEGSYNFPGLANYVTHGNGNSFQIQWGETVPKMPVFTASYIRNNSNYSVYGTNENGSSHSNNVNLRSSYTIDGFQLGAFYTKNFGYAETPPLITTTAIKINSSGDAEGFNLSHRLPLQGSSGFSITRSSWNDTVGGINTSGTVNQINATASIRPTQKISLGTNLNYTDNLNGQIIEAVIGGGGLPTSNGSNLSSSSWDSMTNLGYYPARNFSTSLYFEKRIQTYEGVNYSVASYGGGASYSYDLPIGAVNAAVSVTGNFGSGNVSDSLGIIANANYVGMVHHWRLSAQGAYSQNVQTLLVTNTNSFYNFSGNVQRSMGRLHFALGAYGARTGLTDISGISSTSQGYNASVGYSVWLTATGNYSKSDGTALLTANGLGGVPPVGDPSALFSLYGGESYSATLGSSPIRHLVMSATYSRSISNTNSDGLKSNNVNGLYTAQAQYQLRKLYFTTGYERLLQGFSGSGSPPQVVYSYYAGVSRWFKFF
jgi:hypothetical protein